MASRPKSSMTVVMLGTILMQQFEDMLPGGLIVDVAPVICGAIFAVIGVSAVTRKMLRKWFHKEQVRPTAWYD
jgi:hypothetical protein